MVERRRLTEVRQLELVDAALALVAAEGVSALSTRRLATELGLSSGAVFRHFPSREALLDAVVARVEAVLDESFPPATLPVAERLAAFVALRTSAVQEHLGVLRLVQSEQFHLALPEGAAARLRACVEKSRRFLVGCLREGQRSGAVRADVPAEDAALIVMGAIQLLAAHPRGSARARRSVLSLLAGPPSAARGAGGARR